MGIRERDAQLLLKNIPDNLHKRRVNRIKLIAVPLALATLSTVAAAINSNFDPISSIFGLPGQ